MTREEAKKYTFKVVATTGNENEIGQIKYLNLECCWVIDKIYDDFENRTCKDCKYCYNDPIEGYVCISDDVPFYHIKKRFRKFSCNRFKRIEND
jgi:hypothetical protein